MDRDPKFDQLCRDIHCYYGSQAVPVDGDRTALMLRATGEPWAADEIAQHASRRGTLLTLDELKRAARHKRQQYLASRSAGPNNALVDDYGNVINLAVAECHEIVDAFRALVQLRADTVPGVRSAAVPTQYLRHLLTSLGDALPPRRAEQLLSQIPVYGGEVSLRTVLKLLSRDD
ncbi:calmodulin-like protein 4 [Babesia caballi]|uniref:Calmodulin-like protein 4 n=1 Tax=Babesia caballi TaxID=5871 RepID=A0AAV4LSA1_BABCB|nr:calmodulin-like protein 4 [Babesia caballi]